MVGHILKCKYINRLVKYFKQAKYLKRLHNLQMFICIRITKEWRKRYRKYGVSGVEGIHARRARMALSLVTILTHGPIRSRSVAVVKHYLTYSFQMG